MSEFEKDVIIYSKKIAIASFIIGILIFLVFLLFSLEALAYLGVLFVLFTIFINGLMLLQLIYLWISIKSKRVVFGKVILFVLANIPVAR
tara:strand:- start:2837 stop:3106 length:270 start_codon:yes stop_codon:yes gene_type:complete